MDRYFYSIELDDAGNKIVHFSGNVYYNDEDNKDKDHVYAEWVWLYIMLDELKDALEKKWLFDYLCDNVKYSGDITEEEAISTCEHYFDGRPGEYLAINCVNQETPCGAYWFDGREIYD